MQINTQAAQIAPIVLVWQHNGLCIDARALYACCMDGLYGVCVGVYA
jgi:hypothetical protein